MHFIRKTFILPMIASALATTLACGVARADDVKKLPSLNAPIAETSISGISSGAFMAVQFGVAWSSVIKGVGVVTGGPYYCAQGSTYFNLVSLGAGPALTATGPCMVGPPGDLAPEFQEAQDKAASGDIDPTFNIARQKIYLYHGYNDAVVAKSVMDGTLAFYQHYLGAGAQGNLFYQTTLGSGHSFVVLDSGQKGLDACPANQGPYINQCNYDQAGALLQHIYGALNPPNAGTLGGALKSFDQSAYTGNDIPGALSMGDKGYVYVPKDCEGGAACRVHVALHGCKQDYGTIGMKFVEDTGYNRWADTNRIVVLYPQTQASPFLPTNPESCWDWWGYVTGTDSYVTKSGKQITAIKAMLDALTAGATAPTDPAAAPFNLIVNDTADTMVALAWTAAPGASSYSIARAGADGRFQTVGSTNGLSYGDQGLAPTTAFSWQVTPVVNGVAQTPSNSVSATTLATPATCNDPGSCPLTR